MTFLYSDFANGLWDETANAQGRVSALSDTLTLLAIDPTTYIADQDADVTLADIPSGAILGSEVVTGVVVTARGLTFDAVTFPLVAVGPDIGAVVLFKVGSDDAHSPLIAYADDAATGLPVVTDGTDVIFNPGAGGIAVF